MHLFHGDTLNLFPDLDPDATAVVGPLLIVPNESSHVLRLGPKVLLVLFQSRRQIDSAKRLQQIVDAVLLKGLQGVLIISRRENNRLVEGMSFQKFKYIPIGKVDIEKIHIHRSMSGTQGRKFLKGTRLSDDFDLQRFQHLFQSAESDSLIFKYGCFHPLVFLWCLNEWQSNGERLLFVLHLKTVFAQ